MHKFKCGGGGAGTSFSVTSNSGSLVERYMVKQKNVSKLNVLCYVKHRKIKCKKEHLNKLWYR